MSVAFILQYMVAGTQWVEAQMNLRPLRWMGTGLLTAVVTGLGSMALGYPFMTTHTAHLHLPVLGDFHVASALFFDVGVYSVVVGSTLLILTALAHQSVRSHRPTGLPKPVANPVAEIAASQGAV
jgi:multicomponent K+:H+ antiporter subunit A